jgi:hypothetical protein
MDNPLLTITSPSPPLNLRGGGEGLRSEEFPNKFFRMIEGFPL